jgi:hypothetical protein
MVTPVTLLPCFHAVDHNNGQQHMNKLTLTFPPKPHGGGMLNFDVILALIKGRFYYYTVLFFMGSFTGDKAGGA